MLETVSVVDNARRLRLEVTIVRRLVAKKNALQLALRRGRSGKLHVKRQPVNTVCRLFLLFSLLTSWTARAQDPPFHTRVKLDVVGDQGLHDQIVSFASRELRSLNGVTLVDEKPEWIVSLAAREVVLESGKKAGFAIAYLVSASTEGDALERIVKDGGGSVSPSAWKTLHEQVDKAVIVVLFNVATGSPEDLQSTLQKIVASFDARTLEPIRKYWQKLNDEAHP
jgi:hypothetical protein